MSTDRLQIFALSESRAVGARIAARLGCALAEHHERAFEDGEHKARAIGPVRGADVYVVQSLFADRRWSVNDKLVRLLFFLGSLRDAGAARVTAVLPYLCYARKDRRTRWQDPLSTRYLAQLIEAVGTRQVIALDVHNLAAFENAFRIRTLHLSARDLFLEHFRPLLRDGQVAVVSPDAGGAKRAEALRSLMAEAGGHEVGSAFVEKYRGQGRVSGEAVVGELQGRRAIIVDDLVSTGGTLQRAAAACLGAGASEVFAAATHLLPTADPARLVSGGQALRLVVTDSVATEDAPEHQRLTRLDCAPLFADAIARTHLGEAGVATG